MHYPGPGAIAIKDFISVDGINFAVVDGIPMHVLICQATFNSMEFIHNFHPINIYCYYMKRMDLSKIRAMFCIVLYLHATPKLAKELKRSKQ